LLVRSELLARGTGVVGKSFNVFSFYFLGHEGNQHPIGEVIDTPQIVIIEFYCFFALRASCLADPIHLELVLMVGKSQTLQTKTMTA
jgi:hypothetical protein